MANKKIKELYPKLYDYRMSPEISKDYRELLEKLLNTTDENLINQHVKCAIENANLKEFFQVINKEFNEFINQEITFNLNVWYSDKYLSVSQLEQNIFTNAAIVNTLLLFNTIIFYQFDHLDDENVKLRCFQNLFGMIKDSCLWDCSIVAIDVYHFLTNDIGIDKNYLLFANDFMYVSIAFAWLHEMAHFYYEHGIKKLNSGSLKKELEADMLAYQILLRIIEKNSTNSFDGGVFTENFQQYTYLAPAMLIAFYHTVTLIDKILYDKTISSATFTDLIARREDLINYISIWPGDIDTEKGNSFYCMFEESLNSFIRSLIATDKDKKLEEYKMGGGWIYDE